MLVLSIQKILKKEKTILFMTNIELLEEKLIFYESYHHNLYNKIIHIFFVPMLLYTGFIMINYFNETAGLLGLLGYSGYYIYLDLFGGLSYSVILYLMYLGREQFIFTAAFSIHLVSWLAQILSHKYLEKRAPALMDSFFTSITIAPLYIWLEILSLIGYKSKFIENIYIKGGLKLLEDKKSES